MIEISCTCSILSIIYIYTYICSDDTFCTQIMSLINRLNEDNNDISEFERSIHFNRKEMVLYIDIYYI